MKKVYYLKTCSTCSRILKDLQLPSDFELREIKSEPITVQEIEEMHSLSSSYETLFSRTALKYRALNLKEKNLTEKDYKNYILEEYTFLKRPVFLVDGEIFIGNSKKNIEKLKTKLLNLG